MTLENDNFTVLVVDDDPSVRMLVPNLLRSEGFRALKAANGREAVELSIEHSPDLILMDINMPEMNGLDACIAIKAAPETADIPIIFMTSLGNDVDRLKGFEVGGDDYVIKPLNHQELLARMKRFVDAQKHSALDLESLNRTVCECLEQMRELDADELPTQLEPAITRLLDKLQSIAQSLA